MATDRTIRADLKPYRRGQVWYARGWVPVRRPDGSIARRRIERSAKSSKREEAKRLCDTLAAAYEQRAVAVVRPLSFAKAVINYLKTGGEGRFLTPDLLKRIGTMQCADIDDTLMVELADEFYPNATPATVNRQLYSPIIAVLRQASKSKACTRPDFTRPRGHDAVDKDTPVPGLPWFKKVLPELSRPLAAMMMALTLHGIRPKEAMDCGPTDYDPVGKRLAIKDKNGDLQMIDLADPVWQAIEKYDWQNMPALFGYEYAQRRAAMRALQRACDRAGVPRFGMHTVGRHSFATRMLDEGYSVKHVARMGRWSNEKQIMRRYGHLAKNELSENVRSVGKEWGSSLVPLIASTPKNRRKSLKNGPSEDSNGAT